MSIILGIIAVLLLAACAFLGVRLRAAGKRLERASTRHDVALALVGGDAVRGVESALAAACTLLGAGVALLLVGADGEHGVRARHFASGDLEPLHGVNLDDTELGALDALESAPRDAPVVAGGEGQDSRLARFAAAAGLRGAVLVPLTTDQGLRGALAFGDVTIGDDRRDDAALIARVFADALTQGASLQRALDSYIDNRHEAAAKTLHDPLTDLPTRAILLDALHDGLEHREAGRPLALLVIRLGGVLSAVERLGPLAGGTVLGEIGSRLTQLLRHSDVAARVGESEFALLLLDLRDAAEAASVAQRVYDGLARQVVVGDVSLDTFATIGVRIVDPADNVSMAQVMRDAAAALTSAQSSGKGFEIFDPASAEDDASQIVEDLRQAIHDDTLTLNFQPIIDLRDGTVLGAEALVRWNHPTRGPVAPSVFLPLAEEAGVGIELGHWVVTHAARQLHDWQTRFPRTPPLALSINISAAHLTDPRFSRDVLAAFHDAQIDPECVIVEFSEDLLLSTLDAASRLIDPLQRAGVQIAVDDVGTGHATLEYLRRLPVDILKIGRPFIAALVDRDPGTSTAHAIVRQGEELRMSLVAEGVETALQVTRLRDLGCTMAQGFHLSRPVDAEAMAALIETGTVDLGDLPRPSPTPA